MNIILYVYAYLSSIYLHHSYLFIQYNYYYFGEFDYLSAMKMSEVDELFPQISMNNWQGLYIF